MHRVLAIDVSIQTSQILGGVSLEVAPGAIACLVGRNGAGKTTTLRTIMGYLNPAAGRIEPRGQSIAGLPTHAIFGDLTVAESVLLPTRGPGPPGGPPRTAWRPPTRSSPTSAASERGGPSCPAASGRCSRSRAPSSSTP